MYFGLTVSDYVL